MTTFTIIYVLALIICLVFFTTLRLRTEWNVPLSIGDALVCMGLSILPFINIGTALVLLYIAIKEPE